MSIPNETLAVAAIAVHDVLLELKLKHTFFGGYEIVLLGSNRTTKDVDLVVPVKNSSKDTEYQQIVGALTAHNDFVVALGNRRDAIRAIHTSTGAGVDIMLHDAPQNSIQLPLPGQEGVMLDFYPITHMFIRKIKCLGTRRKRTDEEDLIFLWSTEGVDLKKLKKKLPREWLSTALEEYQKEGTNSTVRDILQGIRL